MITVSRIDWNTQLMHAPKILETIRNNTSFDVSAHVHCNLYTVRGWFNLVKFGKCGEIAVLDAIPLLPTLVKRLLKPKGLFSTYGDRHVHMLLERYGKLFNPILSLVERQEIEDAKVSDYVQCSGARALEYIRSVATGPKYIHAQDEFRPYTNNPTVWLYQGILRWDKGVEEIIDAASLNADVQLLIIGDGPHRRKLETYISKNKLTGRVFLLGKIDNPKKFWDIADYIIVHRKNTRGNTYAEPGLRYRAEANNKPVIELSHNA